MQVPKIQDLQSYNLRDYKNRIIVAGTRGYNNRKEFHKVICDYLDGMTTPVIFISGDASSGADYLIIQWCKKFNYPFLLFPAMWEKYKEENSKYNPAGFIRNAEMAAVASDLIAFYDGSSSGTADMIKKATKHDLKIKIINVSVEPVERIKIGEKYYEKR